MIQAEAYNDAGRVSATIFSDEYQLDHMMIPAHWSMLVSIFFLLGSYINTLCRYSLK
jgi:hypothetical protein